MYNNIGEKIKSLATILFLIEAVAAVILGITLIATDEDLMLWGALALTLGPAVACASSWLLYGFGELIDKVCDIELNTRGEERKSKAQSRIDEERISKLEKMRSKDLITEEEYQKAISKKQ